MWFFGVGDCRAVQEDELFGRRFRWTGSGAPQVELQRSVTGRDREDGLGSVLGGVEGSRWRGSLHLWVIVKRFGRHFGRSGSGVVQEATRGSGAVREAIREEWFGSGPGGEERRGCSSGQFGRSASGDLGVIQEEWWSALRVAGGLGGREECSLSHPTVSPFLPLILLACPCGFGFVV
ncbi:unnamed protein product [Calypogeia fissa]